MYDKLIIDGPYLAHKSNCVKHRLLTSHNIDSTMIHIFLSTLRHIHKTFSIGQTQIAWESHGTPSWRKAILPTYKPSRPADSLYLSQLPDLQAILQHLKIPQFYSPKNEADDVIASLSSFANKTLIYTVDKDMMQLLNEQTHIYKDKALVKDTDFTLRYGISPFQMPDYLAIVGDSSDNIQGIPKYGPVKTRALLNEHIIIENIPQSHEIWSFKTNNYPIVLLNKQLTTLNHKCTCYLLKPDNLQPLDYYLKKYELNTIKNELDLFLSFGGK